MATGFHFLLNKIKKEDGDGLADNYLLFEIFRGNINSIHSDRIGYNRTDIQRVLVHSPVITQNSTVSLHDIDDTTSYKNTSGKTAFAIVSPQNLSGINSSYKLYSSPNNDSISGATLVFDSTNVISLWDDAGRKVTSSLVQIQNNHFVIMENTSSTAININLEAPSETELHGLVIEDTLS